MNLTEAIEEKEYIIKVASNKARTSLTSEDFQTLLYFLSINKYF